MQPNARPLGPVAARPLQPAPAFLTDRLGRVSILPAVILPIRFNELPPLDRWAVLDRELPRLIESVSKSFEIDPSDELAVIELAERHGIGERAMVKQLRRHGGLPYRFGQRWFIRRKTLVLALEDLEQECNPEAP